MEKIKLEPVESAPKDGTEILLHMTTSFPDDWPSEFHRGYWRDDRWEYVFRDTVFWAFDSHIIGWANLPLPPNKKLHLVKII